MKFVVSGCTNLKVLSKSIFSLSKIGDEIYVEPLNNSLTLRTVNSSRSTFVCYTFNKSFFSFFDSALKKNLNETVTASCGNDDVESVEQFKCKIPAKCLFQIFKNAYTIEKNVEKCTITIKYMPVDKEDEYKVYDYDATMIKKIKNKNNEDELYETKFVIMLTCKGGIKKTYIMSISDCESLQAAFNTKMCGNHLNINSKCLSEAMNSYQNDIEEVTLLIDSEKMTVKNYIEYENAKSLVNTQVDFDKNEFEFYEIDKDVNDITFCLKEFKICLGFGVLFDLQLDMYFERKGRPIILSYNVNECFEVNFTLATLSEDLSTQNTRHNISQSQQQQSFLIANESSLDQSTHRFNEQTNKTASSTKSTVQLGESLLVKNSQSQKSNKRTLHDSSNNRVYLEDHNSNSNSNTAFDIRELANENDSIIRSASSQDQDSTVLLPPAKKMRSLMETLFDGDGIDSDEDTNESFENKNPLKSLPVNKSTVYIEETSSEDDDD